jgi:diguanylate cyclase (GGDEF)-like protein
LIRLQNVILEMIAKGEPLAATTERLCVEVEKILPGIVCSVLKVDRDGLLHPLAAASLSPDYSARLDGLAIGPNVGSCGTAAYLRTPIIVTDIETDPRWALYKSLVLSLGFKACWSVPICDGAGAVVGTFAFYYRDKRGPTAIEHEVVGTCVHLCAIALERHEHALERERLASTDALTGLSNWACFSRTLSQLPCDRPDAWAVLLVDLDNLKVTNDTFGHHVGDKLLQAAARQIARGALPDQAFRLGGDEFAVLVRTPAAVQDLEVVAERILDGLRVPVPFGDQVITPEATIGGALVEAAAQNPEVVLQNADFALYHAKETSRGAFVRYWPGVRTSIMKRLGAIREVDTALREGRIDAHYQPIVRLDTREVVGLEALCRLRAEDGTMRAASEFYEAASDAQVASRLTERMLSIVATDIQAWLAQGLAVRHVGINVSSADFYGGKLVEQLTGAFDRANVPLSHVTLEVRESVSAGSRDHIIAREIKALRSRGLRVALDDFGTGCASLTHLLTVPVDIIKIDKSFVARLAPGDRSAAIIDGLISIASKLGIEVVAEGIETADQVSQLLEHGCNLGQGYFYARPLDRHAVRTLLQPPAWIADDPGDILVAIPAVPGNQAGPFAQTG